jgi:murein L,D-transpeptidase YcbB/YkuD
MDPVTAAIVAALAAGATGGITDSVKKMILDAYEGLKTLLKKKHGDQSKVVQAVEELEAKPTSPARKELLKEEVLAAKADQDPELREAAQRLLQQIGMQPDGQRYIQQATGSYIAQAEQESTAQVNVNRAQEG